MNPPKTRADDQLEAWTRATARRVPVFSARPERGSSARVLVLVVIGAGVLVGIVAGAFVVGGRQELKTRDPRDLAASAAEAIATAPGVHYSLSITARDPDGTLGIDSDGQIDFERHRFSGTADHGAGPWMLFFGGPSSGSLIIADGLFVKTEAGPWEPQPPAQTTMLDPFMDRARLSEAVASAFAGSDVDRAIRLAPCGPETCQVIALTLPPAALAGLTSSIFGDSASELPPDMAPVEMNLYVDASGFPVRMETRLKAGTTVTTVTLQLARLDPAPAIAPPIP